MAIIFIITVIILIVGTVFFYSLHRILLSEKSLQQRMVYVIEEHERCGARGGEFPPSYWTKEIAEALKVREANKKRAWFLAGNFVCIGQERVNEAKEVKLELSEFLLSFKSNKYVRMACKDALSNRGRDDAIAFIDRKGFVFHKSNELHYRLSDNEILYHFHKEKSGARKFKSAPIVANKEIADTPKNVIDDLLRDKPSESNYLLWEEVLSEHKKGNAKGRFLVEKITKIGKKKKRNGYRMASEEEVSRFLNVWSGN